MIVLPLLLVVAQAGGPAYTEAQAIELAIKKSPMLAAREFQVEEAEATVDVARRWENPELRFTGLRYKTLIDPAVDQRSYPSDPLEKANIGLRWAPPELGQRTTRMAEAKLMRAEAKADKTQARRDLLALVRSLHAQVVSVDAQIEIARATVEQRKQLKDLIERRMQNSAGTRIEKSIADMDHLDAQNLLGELEFERSRAYDTLLVHLGLSADSKARFVSDGSDACTPVGEPEGLASQAAAANPRAQVVEAGIQSADAERSRRWLSLVPWPTFVQASYVMGGDGSPGYVTFGLGLKLPLLDWKSADRRAFAAKHSSLAEKLKADNRLLEDSVRRTVAVQKNQAALLSRYRESSQVVEQGLEAVKKSIESGESTNLYQALMLQSRLLSARKSALKAELECKLKRIEIDRLTGAN